MIWRLLLQGLLLVASVASAEPAVYEAEPNDTPAEANPIAGAVSLYGAMADNDQDGFVWTVSDEGALKRWTFELVGIPGKLTIAEVVRVDYADNGVDVAGARKLMKMGTRDGLTPSLARDLLFEPGRYLIGLAYGGSGTGAFRPPAAGLSFGGDGQPSEADAPDPEPGAYRFHIREGARLLTSKNPGARESREKAQSIRLGREFATFESRASSWYEFSFDPEDARQRWDIRAQVPVGRELEARLTNADGEVLTTTTADDRGLLVFPDLAPQPGPFFVELKSGSEGLIHAIASEPVGVRTAGEEAEPNGEWKYANRVDLSQPVSGRISTKGETDFFLFSLDEPTADQLLELRIEGTPAQDLEFCLYSGERTRVQCRRSAAPVELPGLVLSSGIWGIGVARAGDGMEYTIRMTGQGAIEPGTEAEPNDAIEFASGVPANHRVKGKLNGDESDFFRFTVVSEPQLWRFQVIGENVSEVAYYDGAGKQQARVRPDPGQQRFRLENLFLLPGQHYLKVSGRDGGSYTVLARALGPPDPDGEREPNNDARRTQHLGIGQTRNGLLVQSDDRDHYRFFLANWDHISLGVEPPADGQVHADIKWYGKPLARRKPAGPGEPISISGLFPPGDYQVILQPTQTSDAEYHLSLQRRARFSCPADCEPEGMRSLHYAPPLPASLAFADGAIPRPAPEPLSVALEMILDAREVSAYRNSGQKLTGAISIVNNGPAALEAKLDAATSDYRWQLLLGQHEIDVPPDGETRVPLEVQVPADAWGDAPVRLSVRARDASGAQQETFREIAVDREAAPVNAGRHWPVPEALRGGMNAAWSAHGGRLEGQYPTALGHRFEQVIDGKSVGGNGMAARGGWDAATPWSLTVKLAGDRDVPVSGIALNHFGASSPFTNIRTATLFLSQDGTTFREVLEIETQPFNTEQFFELGEPVLARFARLRVDATFEREFGRGGISLGEFKIIARPGHDLSGGDGFNLADPALGGHVVWADPPISVHWDHTILTETEEKPSARLRAGQNLEWVVGFHDARAARIARLEWVESPVSATEHRFANVAVSTSMESPVGPWTPLAGWTLNAGGKSTLELEQPAWARFVRFAATGPDSLQWRAAPETLRILERATGEDYRSILGEWGHGRSEAFYEAQHGVDPEYALAPGDNQSRAAAALLTPGVGVAGEVALGKREHWYRLKMPQGLNRLSVTLGGDPTVRTALALEDDAGTRVPLVRKNLTSARRHEFEAVVTSGADYFFRVVEPPRNVVFAWDTSASVNAYLPTIFNSLATFSSQVVPGREAVNLVPFGEGPLLRDWYDQPYVLQTILNDYPRTSSSSAAESTLETAARLLGPMAGTKAIVLITDAATNRDAGMWQEMRTVRPQIFAVGIGGTLAADEEQDRLQDWANVSGGYYTHLVYDGEMEVAFDRAATMLRRPAGYTLQVETEFREAPGPGSLTVVSGASANGGIGPGGTAVELILDASGSMLQRMDGKRRIDIAREVLTEAVLQHIPAGTPVALRVFGHKEPNACRSDLEMPLAPLDPAAAASVIDGIEAMNLARTPIADSLAAVQGDLEAAKGSAAIVLVTDGEETCEGEPGAVIQALQEQGMDVNLNIVGFAIDDLELEAQFQSWAEQGAGRYFSASDQGGLSKSLREALQVPYTVYDSGGQVVAEGLVDGDPVELKQDQYRVEVLTSPIQTFDPVTVLGERAVKLSLD